MKTSRRLRLESSSETLTPAQYSVLAALRQQKHTIGELAQREQIAAPSMTRIIKNLTEAGWVTRAANTQDARQVLIEISAEGTHTFVQARGQRTAWLARRIDQLDEQDRMTLARAAELLQEMSAA
ncbi:MarR family transcriptional regulator [Arthrobacter sp. MYb227]|nr:MarR family transcriptional regulator [Arthrobacter sp. MYb227]